MNSKNNIHQDSHTWLNGLPCGHFAVSDRGLLYGDGFFTTIKVTEGQVEHWSLHSERLAFSAARLLFPAVDLQLIESELSAFIDKQTQLSQSTNGVIRLTISRSTGVRGYKAPASPNVQRYLSWSPLKEAVSYDSGVRLSICSTPPLMHPVLAGIKHCNRLAEVLAAEEVPTECFDGIMSLNDKVLCGTKSNLYFFIDGQWRTPKLHQAGVNGTVRRWLLNNQPNFVEAEISHKDMAIASYCLVSNAIVGIIPVSAIGLTDYELCPDWQKLAHSYRQSAF